MNGNDHSETIHRFMTLSMKHFIIWQVFISTRIYGVIFTNYTATSYDVCIRKHISLYSTVRCSLALCTARGVMLLGWVVGSDEPRRQQCHKLESDPFRVRESDTMHERDARFLQLYR